MSDLASVARLEREVGLPAADAKRIAQKFNKLADSLFQVPWATSVSEKNGERRKPGVSARDARRKSSKAVAARKR